MAMGDSAVDEHEEMVIRNEIHSVRNELRQWETGEINPLLEEVNYNCVMSNVK